MSLKPPPLPASVRSPESNSFARQAADVCLVVPLLMIGLSFGLSGALKNHHDGSGPLLYRVITVVAVGIFAIGVVSGLLALVLAGAGQRARVFSRAGSGLVLLGLLAAIAVPNFVRARTAALQNNAALRDVKAESTRLRAQAVASLNGSDKRPFDTQRLEESLDRAAATSSGDTSAILKGTAAYLQRLQTCKAAYDQASSELIAAKVLAASTLVRRDQIQDRRSIVEKFLAANDAFKTFMTQGEVNYRKELSAYEISPEERETAVKGFLKSLGAQSPVLLEIREADSRVARATLGVLDLLDAQWGRWNYDPSAGLIRFEDGAAVRQYNALMTQIREASAAQEAAQKRVAATLSRSGSAL